MKLIAAAIVLLSGLFVTLAAALDGDPATVPAIPE